MTRKEKKMMCILFFDRLSNLLKDTHNVVGSCNQDMSAYLVPKGTENEITYHSKPADSFRVSDHWNWYANLNKCKSEKYIQCLSLDMPWAKKRKAPGKGSDPIEAVQVAVIGKDRKYHAVFGEVYDRKNHIWRWLDARPEDVIERMALIA